MERLEAKQISGRTYYYYSKWAEAIWFMEFCHGFCQKARQIHYDAY